MTVAEASESRASEFPGGPGYRIILVHHTHWDREWWATYQDFRIRLLELIDRLLDTLDSDPAFHGFLLDGQTVVLRDYLEVRPENRERLLAYLRSGRIQSGPWYILPDEFLVSGESHIRNLWLGIRTAGELDFPLLRVGYIPDTFGHIAQLPQILRGFGIDSAFIWRGRGGDPATVKQEFLWESPDGSHVLAHWFPEGYYQMPFLHFDNPGRPYEDKMGRIFGMIERWGPRATAGVLLMPYGGDHQTVDPRLPAKIESANELLGEVGRIEWGNLPDYLAAVRDGESILEVVRGELRDFGLDHPHVLPGVLSTRLYLKRLNFSAQTWLERYAEPLSALAAAHGGRYDAGLLWKAWELLVQNHPHDSICGCSIDQVHREMIPRFDQSIQIAQILAEKSVQHINARIDTGAHGTSPAVVVHNSLPRRRMGWVSVWLPRTEITPGTHRLLDSDGAEVPFRIRDVAGNRPTSDQYEFSELGFVAGVPGLGHSTYHLVERQVPLDPKQVTFATVQPAARLKGSVAVTDLLVGDCTLENRYLRVRVDDVSGTLMVTDKRTGEVYAGLNGFEDAGDAGDEYSYSQPLNDMVLLSERAARVHVSVAEAGYARATLRIDLHWSLPDGLTDDRLSRSACYRETRLSTYVTLTAGSPIIEITTEWENVTRDHRLRVRFPLGAAVESSFAQGQFSVDERPVPIGDPGNGWPETRVSTMPQQGWVSVGTGSRGLMVANRGLPEFEVLQDGSGTIAVTLLRAAGWLSRDDLISRVGGAGPTVPTPDAECLGPNSASYAVIPHSGSWLDSRAFEQAEEYLVPLYGAATDAHSGPLAPVAGLIEVESEHALVMSACKRAESGDELILRFWNVSADHTEARVRVGRAIASARLVDLKETPLEDGELPLGHEGFVLQVGPAAIVTVAVALLTEPG